MKTIFLALLFTTPIFAALPPFAQTEREIRVIINSKELQQFIPYSDVFEKLTKTEEGYLITTNKREVRAVVHYSNESRVGPAEFSIEFLK